METNQPIRLTPKQQLFCDEYLIDLNATRAALRAGYSASTALNGQLMGIPKIKLYLQQRAQETAQKVQVTHEMVLRELCKIAFGNMGNYFDADGRMKPMDQLSDDEKAALWSVSGGDSDSAMKVRMYNKMAALDKIAKHLKFYEVAQQQPEKVYVYLNPDHLDAHDRFEDRSFDLPEEADGFEDDNDLDEDEEREAEIREQAIKETEQRLREEFRVEKLAWQMNSEKEIAEISAAVKKRPLFERLPIRTPEERRKGPRDLYV
jgi:hypothetical protein